MVLSVGRGVFSLCVCTLVVSRWRVVRLVRPVTCDSCRCAVRLLYKGCSTLLGLISWLR